VLPAEIKEARRSLGLSQTGLAEALRLGPNGERTVRRWESGDVPITGPASLALELLVRGSKRRGKC
jgi:DNA (cytosine-5)-methyltransferase 1